MTGPRILVIGDPSSPYVQSHFDQVLARCGPLDRCSVVDSAPKKVRESAMAFYAERGVRILNPWNRRNAFFASRPGRVAARILLTLALFRELRRHGPFDAVHIHYLTNLLARPLSRRLLLGRPFFRLLVVTFWGSDLNAPGTDPKKQAILDGADIVSISTDAMQRTLLARYGDALSPRIRRARFGLPVIDRIASLRATEDASASRRALGLPEDKAIVVLGHNAARTQRHEWLLRSLAACPPQTLERIQAVLPMTYPKDPDYVAEVRGVIETLGLPAKVLTDFLDPTDVARLRLSSDVFVHALLLDAFSGSMNEALAAGAVVLHGTWLDYPDYADIGVSVRRYSDAPDLTAQLTDVLSHLEAAKRENAGNPGRIRDLCSWDGVRKDWLALYDGIRIP